ncbi:MULTISPECIES: hypothetical protein [unclassified Rhizobium]|uniref:hypothetical protein n=1 Tax=unclassified Rhizobium TaxID=2613769 RepID=UPI001ADAD5F5|nr:MULTISPECIES: hypothetical protein [unclassified Rhizobium]MBO9099869.1 hypothetical protein [Rhizobium sp. L58/93]MBO9131589.1 hypothetical protein [Rhizobium sp. B209b/85]MBO9185816.1 hypothetical protein [Rhizobium sp. E27B/91]QXZ82577.1 hypothetical protein J5287_10695 [Rhizobium sp. K1/93]QXZ89911.1 hypothetical protein J5280_17895 [Rhizobium sp. K15/93]
MIRAGFQQMPQEAAVRQASNRPSSIDNAFMGALYMVSTTAQFQPLVQPQVLPLAAPAEDHENANNSGFH